MAELPVSVCVVGPQYMVPNQMDMIFIRKGSYLSTGSLLITDTNNKIMFMVKKCETHVHERLVLVDAANIEQPIVTLQSKIMSGHDRWQVFRGDSTDNSDLIFSSKTPHLIQFHTKLNLYLSTNNEEDSCDFRLEGSWSDRGCKIYHGNSSTVIAQMHMQHPTENEKLGKNKFMVTISPHIDYAFIVTIFSILNTLKSFNIDAKTTAELISGVADIAGGIDSS